MTYTRNRSWASDAVEQYILVRGTSNQDLGPYLTDQETKEMSDVVVSDYHQKVASGVVVNNDCLLNVVKTTTSGSGFGSYKAGSYDYTISGPLTWFRAGQVYPPGSNINLDADAGTAKFYALAAIDNTPYAFGEDTLEIRETLKFLRDPLKSLRELSRVIKGERIKVYRKYSKGTKRGPPNSFDRRLDFHRALADVWLQYRFAASPLVRSIHDGYEALKLPREEPPKVLRQSARGFSEDSGTAYEEYSTYESGTTYQWWKSRVRHVKYHATILYEITNPARGWRHTLGLRNKDLPETFWQVLPYTFMVDRIANVSAAIRGLTNLADPRINILAASCTRRDSDELSFALADESRGGWTISASGETRTRKYFTYERETYSPSISDVVPPVNIRGLAKDTTELLDTTNLILKNLR